MRSGPLDIASAHVGVVVLEGIDHILHGQAETGQPFRKRRNDVFLAVAADRVDLGHARNRSQLWPDDPIVKRPQVLRGIGRPIGLDRTSLGLHRIHEDLAKAGRDGAELRLNRFRQGRADPLKPFVDQLPGEIDIRPVLEDDRDLAESVTRNRSRV